MTGLIVLLLIIILIPSVIKEQKNQRELKKVVKKNSVLAVDFNLKKEHLKSKGFNTSGIYIFTNISKRNRKYVGQSVNVLKRVENHMKGYGNPDVYRDLRRGDTFIIEFVKLKETKFRDLNSLERHFITKYNSYYNGYNKTRGNF